MPTAKIDDKEVTVEKGTTILEAALQNDIFIPHYCYHPALKIDGNCRMCLVEVEKMPKLTIACNTVINDGMVVHTKSEKVIKTRKGVLEFFLINHPLDCGVCDKAGECKLQDYSVEYGEGKSRFKEKKITQAKKDLGGNILIYSDRCILCARCVRFCSDVAGSAELDIINRGGHNEIDIFPGKKLTNKLAGNVVDICPVGALKRKDFLFKRRVWLLNKINTVCPRCSTGCNVTVEVAGDNTYDYRISSDKVYRVMPRHNQFVNGYWMCDEGRYDWDDISNGNRLKHPQKKQGEKLHPTDLPFCINEIKTQFSRISQDRFDSIGAILSATMTNEETYLLIRLMKDVFNSKNIALQRKHSAGEDERFPLGFTIEADKTPNYYGASLLLGDVGIGLDELMEKIRSGAIKGLYIAGSAGKSGFTNEEIDSLKKLEFLVVQDSVSSDLTAVADIVLPSSIGFEENGSYTNSKGIVQRLEQVLMLKEGTHHGWQIIQMIAEAFEKSFKYSSAQTIFDDIAENVSAFKGMSYKNLENKGKKVQ